MSVTYISTIERKNVEFFLRTNKNNEEKEIQLFMEYLFEGIDECSVGILVDHAFEWFCKSLSERGVDQC